jgi:hypothetical protein
MAVAAVKAKPAARTPAAVHQEEPEVRTPDRGLAADLSGPILTRSGQPAALRFTGAEDKFAFDRSIIPEGWDYQWKAAFVKNAPNTQHMTEMEANNWEPVPASRHDGLFMPRGHKGNIERGGQVLMERDIRLTLKSRASDKREADERVRLSRSPVGLAGSLMNANPGAANMADFADQAARAGTGVKTERTPMGNPDRRSGYTYTLEE